VAAILALVLLSCPVDSGSPSKNVCTVTFDSRGGSAVASQTVAIRNRASPPERPGREGFVFTGWYGTPGSVNRYDFDTPVTDDITLYAAWEAGSPAESRALWVQDLNTSQYYQVEAELLAQGRYCDIWVEREPLGLAGPIAAQRTADAYDQTVYPLMINVFSVPVERPGSSAGNILDYADQLTDRNGKLSILLVDIKDNYNPPATRSYVGGYFGSVNFYARTSFPHSNQMDMIYLDTYPGVPGDPDSNQTLAHETQHLVNWTTRIQKTPAGNSVSLMETWIDEGLSSAAEYLSLGGHPKDRYQWFNNDSQGTIARGNNFFVWGNYDNDSVMDDYATVYLFFQWLRIHAGGTDIYKSIINSPYGDYRAVTGAAAARLGGAYNDWGTLLKTWLAANYLNVPSGPYGYGGQDPILNTIQARTAPRGTTALSLLPGEGVYSATDSGSTSSYAAGSGSAVKYAGLSKAGGTGELSDTTTFNGGALLTFNASPNPAGAGERGNLTGQAALHIPAPGLSRAALFPEGPIRIDARDALARQGHPEAP
jgi:uncharacterized repeat protein (TIGR02543 family)